MFSLYKSQSKTLINNFEPLNRYFLKRYYKTKRIIISAPDSSAFRASFLENQCGLSGKSLIRASNLLNFEPSDEKPISVLKLFQTFGFSQPNITKIISTHPLILRFHSQKTIKPKLDFLVSITESETDVVRMVTANPVILRSSLNNQLIPTFNLLKSVTGRHQDAAAVIKCKPSLLTESISKCVLPNMEFLLTLGVPSSQILKLATCYGTVLGRKHDNFSKNVIKVKDIGFDLSSSYFVSAVQTLSFNTDSTWKFRCELFRSFGFTNNEILYMFKKWPTIMTFTENKVRELMEFFVNKLGWSPSSLSTSPAVLAFSFEKRTIPRCSVLQALVLKKVPSRSIRLLTVLQMTEKKFVNEFVTSHKDEVPEVLDAYHGKLRFDEYNFESEGKIKLRA